MIVWTKQFPFSKPVSKITEFAGNLPRKFISFRHLGFESSAHSLPEGRESENAQNNAEIDEVNTVVVGETPRCPAKVISILQGAALGAESIRARVEDEDRDLTMAEKGLCFDQ